MTYRYIDYTISASGKCRIISKGKDYNKIFDNENECREYIRSLGTAIHSYRKLTNYEKTDYRKTIEMEFNVPFQDFIDIAIHVCYNDENIYEKVKELCNQKYYFYC